MLHTYFPPLIHAQLTDLDRRSKCTSCTCDKQQTYKGLSHPPGKVSLAWHALAARGLGSTATETALGRTPVDARSLMQVLSVVAYQAVLLDRRASSKTSQQNMRKISLDGSKINRVGVNATHQKSPSSCMVQAWQSFCDRREPDNYRVMRTAAR